MRTVKVVFAVGTALLTACSWRPCNAGGPPPAPRVAVELTGDDSAIAVETFHRVRDARSLKILWRRHLGKPNPEQYLELRSMPELRVDFQRYEVIAVFGGEMIAATHGYRVDSLASKGSSIAIQVTAFTRQVVGDPGLATPFAFFVVERSAAPISLQFNRQTYKG